jgi:hypothetical protein
MAEPVKRRLIPILVLLAACSGKRPPPTADQAPAMRPPDLTGRTVMVLPAQPSPNGPQAGEPVAGLDREIAFWLAEKAPRVKWVFPSQLERILERSPSIEIDIHALAVSAFHRAEVRNIGDPLFGDLYRLSTLVDSRIALVPVSAGWVRDADGTGRVETAVALIETFGGRVLWYGVVAGATAPEGSTTAAASAAEALAARITG